MRAISFLFLAAVLAAQTPQTEQGIAAFNAGKYAEALKLLASDTSSDGIAFRAMAQAAEGDCKSSLPQLVESAKTAPPKIARLAALSAAKCSIDADNLPQAESLLSNLPQDADVLYLQAELHMRGFNQATAAMFQRAPASYRVHQLSAEIFENENRFSEAVTEYKEAIRLNPSAPDLHYRLGRAMLLESHSSAALTQAAEQFRQELKLSPEDAACEFQLGQIARAQGDPASAQQHFEHALAMSPSFVQAMIALASAKKPADAIALLVQATKLQPDNEAAHYALMKAYRDSGDLASAKRESDILKTLQQPPEGEFSQFLKKLGAQ